MHETRGKQLEAAINGFFKEHHTERDIERFEQLKHWEWKEPCHCVHTFIAWQHLFSYLYRYVVCGINWCMFCINSCWIIRRDMMEREEGIVAYLFAVSSVSAHKFLFTFDVAYHHLLIWNLWWWWCGQWRISDKERAKILNLFIATLFRSIFNENSIQSVNNLLIFLSFLFDPLKTHLNTRNFNEISEINY